MDNYLYNAFLVMGTKTDSFLENNPNYDRLITRFQERKETAIKVIDFSEFLENEIKRLQNIINELPELSQPIKSDLPYNFAWCESGFTRDIYEKLRKGVSLTITLCICYAWDRHSFTWSISDNILPSDDFIQTLVPQIEWGAAYAQYHKFLKDEERNLHSLNEAPLILNKNHQSLPLQDGKKISEQYIKPLLIEKLNVIESKMEGVISEFSQIKCAAWVELLRTAPQPFFRSEFNKHYIKYCTAFAKARYNIEIYNQLQTTKKKDRGDEKERLKHHLNP